MMKTFWQNNFTLYRMGKFIKAQITLPVFDLNKCFYQNINLVFINNGSQGNPLLVHSTLISVREPGARTNWLSLPMRDLMKVWDLVMSVSPALLRSNLAQVLGKNSAM